MQIGPRIRFDKHSVGNFLKNVAPLAAFTPAGILGAGALGLAGGLGRGESFGKAAMSGVSNAALGGGAASVAGKLGLGSGAHLGFGLGGESAAASVPSGPPPVVPTGGLALPPTPNLLNAPPPSLGAKAANVGGGLLNFAEEHPNAAAGALQGVGSIVGSGADNRLQNAQAANLEQQAGETAYDFDRRRRRDAEMSPAWGALGTSIGNSFGNVSANPYLPKAGAQ